MAEYLGYEKFVTSRGTKIFRLPLEAFPKFWAFAYLVIYETNIYLIDTGSGSESSNQGLIKGFQQASEEIGSKIQLDDLTHILITHGHIDHMGGLVFLRQHTHASIGVHELDVQTISSHEERLSLLTHHLYQYLGEAGVGVEERSQLLQLYKFTKAFFHSVPVDFTYERQGLECGPFKFIHLPGHCAGQVGIKLDDFVFCGDHILSSITPHQSPERLVQFLGLRHYLESLTLMEKWVDGDFTLLVGHDQPIKQPALRIAAIRKSIQGRLRQCLEYLIDPHNIVELTRHIYGQIAGYNALLVLEKTGAYVEYLYQHGFLEISNVNELEETKETTLLYRSKRKKFESIFFSKEDANVLV